MNDIKLFFDTIVVECDAHQVMAAAEAKEINFRKIDDKHIEVIASQMLKKVEVTSAGDSTYVTGDSITRSDFAETNERLIAAGEKPVEAMPLLLGITKASLTTESFISAASFQETTKVLNEAAVSGKIDFLTGLKENVIVGHRIPAGTGLKDYQNVIVGSRKEFEDIN